MPPSRRSRLGPASAGLGGKVTFASDFCVSQPSTLAFLDRANREFEEVIFGTLAAGDDTNCPEQSRFPDSLGCQISVPIGAAVVALDRQLLEEPLVCLVVGFKPSKCVVLC
jgi:hypothetical protein